MMRTLFRSALVLSAAVIFANPVARAQPVSDEAAQHAPERLPIEDVTNYPPDEQAVRDVLKRPVTMTAERLPLGKVIQKLSDQYGLDFFIDNGALRSTEYKGEVVTVPVSIQPADRLDIALEEILDDVGLDFRVSHSCVAITTRDSRRMDREIRVYDVSPLVGHDASSMDVATLLRDAFRAGAVEAQGQGSLLIVRHNRDGQAQVLKKLNKFTREEVRKVAASRARVPAPIVVPPPPQKLPKVTVRTLGRAMSS